MSNQDIPHTVEQYNKSGLYGGQMETRNEFSNPQHKRQISSLHGQYNHTKGHSLSEQVPKEGVYGQVPDLPPRIDRAIKPIGLVTSPNKIPNGCVISIDRGKNKIEQNVF